MRRAWTRDSYLQLLLLMMLGGGFTLPAVAQDPTADDKDAQFEQAFADFRESASWFEALRSEFQTADDARRAAINAELATAYPTIKEKVNLMVTAALDAYTRRLPTRTRA